jgi:hypothetical protein
MCAIYTNSQCKLSCQKQMEEMEYFNYLGNMTIRDKDVQVKLNPALP